MKKNRTIFLGVAAGVMALAVGAFALSANSGALAIFAEPVLTPTHTIVLDGSNMQVGTYDENYYAYPLHFHGDKVIGGLYDFDTADSKGDDLLTYIIGAEDSFSFGANGHIAEFTSAGWECSFITFKLEDRAVIDFDKSVVNYSINGVYQNVKPDYALAKEEGYIFYEFSLDCYSNFGDEIIIDSIKIVFHC
ncbi:MAG: hypothetical protein IJS37_06035 [Bacilli bacterium]|nr:hypothetical protein [Bacilli bacterium]